MKELVYEARDADFKTRDDVFVAGKNRNSLLSSPSSCNGTFKSTARLDCSRDYCYACRSCSSSKEGSCSSPRPLSSSFHSSCLSQTRPSSCRGTSCPCPGCSSRARCSSCSSALPSPPPLDYDGVEAEEAEPVCQWCRAEAAAEETREIIIDHSSIVVRLQGV